MRSRHTSLKTFQNRSRSRKLFINLGMLLIASALHFCLQLMLGSYIADSAIKNLPHTTQVSLMILMFVFLTVTVSLFLQSKRVLQNRHERVLVNFIVAFIFSLITIVFLRVPYSNVFIFWGFALQILLVILVVVIFERSNKPIIGLTKQALLDVEHLVASDTIRTISPTMSKVEELDLVVLSES